MELTLAIGAIQAMLAAAPQVEALVIAAKNWATNLFSEGKIDVATQQKLHDHIDHIVAETQAGRVPSHWQVEADPS